jgi:hypothetical protein
MVSILGDFFGSEPFNAYEFVLGFGRAYEFIQLRLNGCPIRRAASTGVRLHTWIISKEPRT